MTVSVMVYVTALCLGALVGIVVSTIHTANFESKVENKLNDLESVITKMQFDIDVLSKVKQYGDIEGNCFMHDKTARMRVLIDVPKAQYGALNAKSQSEVKAIINTPQLVRAIKNGKPFDSVLDNIKAEIKDYESDCIYHLSEEDYCRTCNNITFGSIYRIIDRYKESEDEE